MMDPDVRAFCFALGYNAVVLVVALAAWIFAIRPIRKDSFRPNPRKRKDHLRITAPRSDSLTITIDESALGSSLDLSQLPPMPTSKCCKILPSCPWVHQLWRWDIDKFASTDVYLYLLFLKYAALLFLLVTLLSVGIAFPVTYTAQSVTTSNGFPRARSFFERAVITNIPSNDSRRLWVIYALVFAIAGVALYFTWCFYLLVRSDEFRTANASKRRHRHSRNRFLPSKYSVQIVGLERHLLDARQIRRALVHFYTEDEIVAVHVVMDHSEALAAHRAFQEYLSNLLDAQRQHTRTTGHPPASELDSRQTGTGWAIRLPSLDQSTPMMMLANDTPRPPVWRHQDLNEPLLEAWSITSLADRRLNPWSSPRRRPQSPYAAAQNRGESSSSSGSEDSTSSTSGSHMQTVTRGAGTGEAPAVVEEVDFRSRLLPSLAAQRLESVKEGPEDTREEGTMSPMPDLEDNGTAWAEVTPSRSGRRALLRCGRKRGDTQEKVNHWEAKVLNQYSVLNRIKGRAPTRNVGMAFVSFLHPDAARFALSHDFGDPSCPMFRTRAACDEAHDESDVCRVCGADGERHVCVKDRWNPRWKIREAPPPEDLIWENAHISNIGRFCRRVFANLLIFLLSLILTSSALAADALNPFAQHIEDMLQKVSFLRMSVSGWIAPLFLYLINALVLPLLVAWAANTSKFWRNSARDRAVLHGNTNFMVLNSIVFPVIGTTSIQGALLFLYKTPVSNLFSALGQLVAGASGSFMSRYVLNAAFINSSFQLLQLPMFSQQRVLLKLGKKPTRWQFDFGYWYAFHLSLLALCLIFSVDIPFVPALGCLFFTAKYWVDKYNFSFAVWKVTSESAGAVASTVVSFMCGFVSFFLLVMASYFVTVGLHAASVARGLLAQLPRIDHETLFDDEPRELQGIPIPDSREPRALVIGGIVLLSCSALLFLITFGERAQRSIIDRHAGKVRRIGRAMWTYVARKLAEWNIRVPHRLVVETGLTSPELTRTELDELRKAYAHPYERDEPLALE